MQLILGIDLAINPSTIILGNLLTKTNVIPLNTISIQISTEGAKDVIFHVVYRPPNLSKSQFLDEFGMFLEGAALSGYENILLGDLNFYLDKHDTWTLKFYDILGQFSFTQLFNTPTHIQGHILDALCVRDSFYWAISPKVIGVYQTTRQSYSALSSLSGNPVSFNVFPSVKFTR